MFGKWGLVLALSLCAGAARAASAPDELSWQPLWSVDLDVGGDAKRALLDGRGGQIAVRGPLIVVATGGLAGHSLEHAGVHVIDGSKKGLR